MRPFCHCAAALAFTVIAWTPALAADASETYTQNEIYSAATDFFGTTTKGLAEVVEKVFQEQGEPNAYITGEEVAGAVGVGLRYGNGTLHRKGADGQKVYWQGPSIGFDLGANAAKVFTLVYRLGDTDELFQRFPGVEGTVYIVAGFGVNYQQSGEVILAPIRTGVGLRAGANVGYLHYGRKHSWIPF